MRLWLLVVTIALTSCGMQRAEPVVSDLYVRPASVLICASKQCIYDGIGYAQGEVMARVPRWFVVKVRHLGSVEETCIVDSDTFYSLKLKVRFACPHDWEKAI